MVLSFKNIVPQAFQHKKNSTTIWGNEIRLESPGVYQIIAASGSGKSTLVSILAGIRGDYLGDIYINEKKVSGFNYKDWNKWRSLTSSFVFQDLRLFSELSALENIQITREISGGSDSEENIREITTKAAELGIDDSLLKKKVNQLSLGQAQRIAILRAINKAYSWLILDEPFSHLDLNNTRVAWEQILSDAYKKRAGIIITCLDPYPFIEADKTFIL